MNFLPWRKILPVLLGLLVIHCSSEKVKTVVLETYPVNSMDGVISLTHVSLDTSISYDGNGSLKFMAQQPTSFSIYETGDLEIENCCLIYQAQIRTRNVQGDAYLEMWCHFPGKGEFFSRALNSILSGDTNWTRQESQFFLKNGENPDNVRLNVVIEGSGTVWIDDIRLITAPL